ncbi:efflux RND transporter periplasmic adaptor subunit [Pedobacter mucosus]|uniref:efflux RND transporter periplasmic adaptor subunit n=1 Tax=Pedobacter mucosus TaxID=2895286 RepID=UPI001EE3FB90|nr:efflux RND transporter periplasmic adaptor subunit [Pedobacter mucosus]UKT62730.1 efflux RND transporter periplasmic adaptor subunit [Pedobacter mucosus]
MKNIKYIMVFAVLLFTVLACNQDPKEEVQDEPKTVSSNIVSLSKDQYRVADIGIGKMEMRNMSNVLKANGTIDVPPESMVTVSAPLGGYIKSSGLLPGQLIKKGQVIAVIENAEFIDIQQEYLESRSRLEYLSLEYKRQDELRKEDVNSAKTYQQVASEYKIMQARMGGLEQKLSMIGINASSLKVGNISKTSNLYAPINGYVTISNAVKGKYVNPTDVIFELANKSEMHLALNIYERDAANIKIGQSIQFALASETEYNRIAKVFLIGKEKGSDGTIPVHCHMEKSNDPSLFPGMYAKALIETTDESVTAVPSEAVVQSDGQDYIFIQTGADGKGFSFKMIVVKKEIDQGGYTAIELPVQFDKNSNIVIKGAYALLSTIKNVEE